MCLRAALFRKFYPGAGESASPPFCGGETGNGAANTRLSRPAAIGKRGSAGKPRGAAAPFNYLSVFFSPMESRAFKMMPKIAAPAMQGTFSPKKGMLPPKA